MIGSGQQRQFPDFRPQNPQKASHCGNEAARTYHEREENNVRVSV